MVPGKGKLLFLDGFRGLLCVWIVLFHYTTRYSLIYDVPSYWSFNNGGVVGVAMFFIISGFLMQYTIEKYYLSSNKIKWLGNKIVRIYPGYAISLLIIFISIKIVGLNFRDNVSFSTLCNNLVFGQLFGASYIEGAHWYVIDLVQFYFIYFVIAHFRWQNNKIFYILVFAFIVLGIFFKMYNPDEKMIIKIWDRLVLGGNVLSMLSGVLMCKVIENRNDRYYQCLFILFVLVLSIKVHLTYIPLLSLGLLLLILKKENVVCIFISDILCAKYFIFLGTVSYTWYLLHQNIGYQILQKMSMHGMNGSVTFILPLAFTLLLAVLVYYLVEKRFVKYLRNKIKQ